MAISIDQRCETTNWATGSELTGVVSVAAGCERWVYTNRTSFSGSDLVRSCSGRIPASEAEIEVENALYQLTGESKDEHGHRRYTFALELDRRAAVRVHAIVDDDDLDRSLYVQAVEPYTITVGALPAPNEQRIEDHIELVRGTGARFGYFPAVFNGNEICGVDASVETSPGFTLLDERGWFELSADESSPREGTLTFRSRDAVRELPVRVID